MRCGRASRAGKRADHATATDLDILVFVHYDWRAGAAGSQPAAAELPPRARLCAEWWPGAARRLGYRAARRGRHQFLARAVRADLSGAAGVLCDRRDILRAAAPRGAPANRRQPDSSSALLYAAQRPTR